jgi:hypothetical protein
MTIAPDQIPSALLALREAERIFTDERMDAKTRASALLNHAMKIL